MNTALAVYRAGGPYEERAMRMDRKRAVVIHRRAAHPLYGLCRWFIAPGSGQRCWGIGGPGPDGGNRGWGYEDVVRAGDRVDEYDYLTLRSIRDWYAS